MVVKDPCGSVYIGNITFIPFRKRWVYDMIYKTFFIIFLGKLTISRNILGLIDDDEAKWGPLDDAIAMIIQQVINLTMIHLRTTVNALTIQLNTQYWDQTQHGKI